jgi:peptidoglycan/LPS O-acetylase OafA/YrhL
MEKQFKDIQSLRAVAVLLVLGYHLNSEFFKFGYLGVDIFFVISGFIIVHILSKNSDLNIKNFYFKRIARIYPAMTLVVLFSTFFGIFYLRGDDLNELARQGVLSILGVSNIYFSFTQTGYFQVESFRQPLLHLWSLSTELQFYLIAPFFILGMLKVSYKLRIFLLLGLSLVSLGLYTDLISFPNIENYYLLTSRIWEFVLGGAVAFANKNKRIISLRGKYLSIVSLVVIFFLNYISIERLHDSVVEVSIVLLSSLIILQAVSNGNSGKSHSPKIFVFLGDLSYAIYLWHWPILYFLKNLTSINGLSLTITTLLLTIIFSLLSYFLWENLFRKNVSPQKKILLFIFIFLTVILSSLSSVRAISDLRFSDAKQRLASFQLSSGFSNKESACISDYGQSFEVWDKTCLPKKSNSNQELALRWGDSHVAAIADAFEFDTRFKNVSLARASTTACPPIKSINSVISPNLLCNKNNDYVWNYLKKEKPDTVILVARWYIFANFEWYESGLSSLQKTIDQIQKMGIERIILVGTSPEWGDPLPEILWKQQLSKSFFDEKMLNSRVANLRDINYNLIEMSDAAQIQFIDPLKIWCESEICSTYRDKDDFYVIQIDGDHLSVGAAKEIVNLFE